jgi:hypothetical protein
MNQALQIYYKNLADNYTLAFDGLNHSSIALSLIKGIAMDFEFDVLKYLNEQIAKGKTQDEKEKIKIKANEKVKEKKERILIMRNAINALEGLVGREEGFRAYVVHENRKQNRLLDKIRELETKIENMEIFMAKDGE